MPGSNIFNCFKYDSTGEICWDPFFYMIVFQDDSDKDQFDAVQGECFFIKYGGQDYLYLSCRVCFTNDSQPGPLLFQDDGYRDQFDVVQNECLSKMVADYNKINQLINQITVICAEYFFYK